MMDVGESLNPAIDIGQIEGAFAQGQGLFTLEEHRYSPEGVLYTRAPGAYKIPGKQSFLLQFESACILCFSNYTYVLLNDGLEIDENY